MVYARNRTLYRKGKASNSMGIRVTHRSSNPGQTITLRDNYKEEKNFTSRGFCCVIEP